MFRLTIRYCIGIVVSLTLFSSCTANKHPNDSSSKNVWADEHSFGRDYRSFLKVTYLDEEYACFYYGRFAKQAFNEYDFGKEILRRNDNSLSEFIDSEINEYKMISSGLNNEVGQARMSSYAVAIHRLNESLSNASISEAAGEIIKGAIIAGGSAVLGVGALALGEPAGGLLLVVGAPLGVVVMGQGFDDLAFTRIEKDSNELKSLLDKNNSQQIDEDTFDDLKTIVFSSEVRNKKRVMCPPPKTIIEKLESSKEKI